jgi:acyl-CoA reductase-like NAD-dependent aldehyde dehydrogenase
MTKKRTPKKFSLPPEVEPAATTWKYESINFEVAARNRKRTKGRSDAKWAEWVASMAKQMRLAQEEVFGPVISILPFDDEDEAIDRANASDYGLAAVVWTKDLVLAHTMATRLRAGTVFVNLLPLIDPGAPWGGFGLSGWGREMGAFAIDEFTEPKGVFIGLES